MTERQKSTKQVNEFFTGKKVPDDIEYKPGHTIINSHKFINVNLGTINSDTADKFWQCAFNRLNELREAIENETLIDINSRPENPFRSIRFEAKLVEVKRRDTPVIAVPVIEREPMKSKLELDTMQTKKVKEPAKKKEYSTVQTLF